MYDRSLACSVRTQPHSGFPVSLVPQMHSMALASLRAMRNCVPRPAAGLVSEKRGICVLGPHFSKSASASSAGGDSKQAAAAAVEAKGDAKSAEAKPSEAKADAKAEVKADGKSAAQLSPSEFGKVCSFSSLPQPFIVECSFVLVLIVVTGA